MRILIITNCYPDSTSPYRGSFIHNLCLELQRQGQVITVLTPRIAASSAASETMNGIRVCRFSYPSGGQTLGQASGVPIAAMMLYMVSGLTSALRLITKERPDVIHGNWIVPTGLIAALAGKLTGTPVINTARGMDTRIGAKGPIKWLFDLTIKLSDRVTVVSEAMRAIHGLEQADLTPSGINEAFFEIRPDPTSRQVVFTRSLEPIYDCETLIRAVPLVIKQIPNARFVIAGDGSQATHLKNLARELKVEDCVEFTGRVPSADIRSLLTESKVFVSPALADGTSPAMLEALAAGLHVVTSGIEANRPWMQAAPHGQLFELKDNTELAEKIIHALKATTKDPQQDQARQQLKNLIVCSDVARNFANIYRSMC